MDLPWKKRGWKEEEEEQQQQKEGEMHFFEKYIILYLFLTFWLSY